MKHSTFVIKIESYAYRDIFMLHVGNLIDYFVSKKVYVSFTVVYPTTSNGLSYIFVTIFIPSRTLFLLSKRLSFSLSFAARRSVSVGRYYLSAKHANVASQKHKVIMF